MHLHGLRLLPLIGYLSSLGTAATFFYAVYKQIKRGVSAIVEAKNAVIVMVAEHHEMYGWYSAHVKPKHKQKPNGVGVHS